MTVLIPAFNEERRLGATISRVVAYLVQSGIDAEVLVIDDGSFDRTQGIALEQLRGRRGRVLTNPENRGKGFSVRRGVLEAAGRWVLLTDADLSTPIEEHRTLAAVARERDLDVVIGSRALRDSRVEIRQSLLRQTMGKTFNKAIKLMTGLRFSDTQCGFKLFDRDRVRPIFERMRVDRFAFDVEFLFLCDRFKIRVAEVPVVWRNAEGSKVSLVGDPVNMLWDVAKVRWHFRRGVYNPGAPADAGGGGAESP